MMVFMLGWVLIYQSANILRLQTNMFNVNVPVAKTIQLVEG